MRRVAVLVLPLALVGCGDGGPSQPRAPDFPRSFTSVSESCSKDFAGPVMVAPGVFQRDEFRSTVESSSEGLFAGEGTILHRVFFDIAGNLLSEEYSASYEPAAVDGEWFLDVVPVSIDGTLRASGNGTGELSGRTIQFDMEPLSDDCGYRSSGTIG